MESEINPGEVKSLLLDLSEHLAQKFPGIVTEEKCDAFQKINHLLTYLINIVLLFSGNYFSRQFELKISKCPTLMNS